MLAFSGDGALVAEKRLKKQGYNIKQAVNTVMMNNIKLPYPIMNSLPIYNQKEMEKIREKAEKRMEKLVDLVLKGEKWIEGKGVLGIIGGMMQRSFVAITGWSRWAKNFYVDQEVCINCNQCIEYCPTGNIMVENGEYKWGEKCICCVRCYNLCPTDAIQYKQATMNRQKYPRFKGPIKDFTPSLQRK
jgi:ferredoxin